MKGLELSRQYFENIVWPNLLENAKEFLDYMAIGLVGEGSECFALDDDVSMDHDFGPGVCIWLPEKVYVKAKDKIESILEQLPKDYLGYKRNQSDLADRRIGLFTIEEFYYKYTKSYEFPMSDKSFFEIPESFLATCTNGQVFIDNYGEFTRIRNYLLNFYPKDIYLKKLSAYLAHMGQAGQYNFLRSLKRNDLGAMYFSKSQFIESTFGALFLLLGVYKPYYKLASRRLEGLDFYPKEFLEDIFRLMITTDSNLSLKLIESISSYVGEIVSIKHKIGFDDKFLISSALKIQALIEDKEIRSLHIMKGN